MAVQYKNLENLRYIHSVKPELLLVKDSQGRASSDLPTASHDLH